MTASKTTRAAAKTNPTDAAPAAAPPTKPAPRRGAFAAALAGALALAAPTAGARAAESVGLQDGDDTPIFPAGFSVQAGGGVTGYSRAAARERLGTGAFLEVRAVYGVRSYLGTELAYVGSGREASGGGLGGDALLMSHGFEWNGRYSLPLSYREVALTPFLFGGMGYSRLTLINGFGDRAVAGRSMKEGTNALTLPFGGGLHASYQGLAADLRFTYRRVLDDDLMAAPGQGKVNLENWAAGLTVGYDF